MLELNSADGLPRILRGKSRNADLLLVHCRLGSNAVQYCSLTLSSPNGKGKTDLR